MEAPNPTSLANGRYEVRGVLGEGAQGVTFHAVDASGRGVAIKRFDVRGAKSWKDVELAEREARVLASLDHPLVPRYIEHFEENGQLYLVMEKVEGETLDAMRRRVGPIAESEVRRFLADADRALTYLHGRASPIVHRDLKPRNVIRRPDGSYVLVDFGAVSELMRKTSSTIVGTMGYMAPEQFQGRALPTTDVYAVGATALAALTGVEPENLPHHGLKIDVRAALANRVSPDLANALDQMLEPDPDRRARSLAAALDGLRTSSNWPAAMPQHTLQVPVAHFGSRNGYLPPQAYLPQVESDRRAKSFQKLVWALWGLSWAIVPMALGTMHVARFTPLVMFSALAVLLVLSWDKGAIFKALLQRYDRSQAGLRAEAPASPRQRVEVDEQRVRVHSTTLRPEEVVGDTEVRSSERRRRAAV